MQDLEKTVAEFVQEIAQNRFSNYMTFLDTCHLDEPNSQETNPTTTIRCVPLVMLQHDIDSKLRNINGYATFLQEDFPDLSVNQIVSKVGKAAEEIGILLQRAIIDPRVLLSQNQDNTSQFKSLYGALLDDIPTPNLNSFSSRDAGEINQFLICIENSQRHIQQLIASHLNYGDHFDLLAYVRGYEGKIGAVVHTPDPLYLPSKLATAVDTLLQNIHKAEGNVVTVTHRPSGCGEYVHVDFTDNGRGIHPEVLPHIFLSGFSRFAQEGITPTHGKNSGLGLGYSRQLAITLGGDLDVHQTQEGVGTTFRLSVPLKHVKYNHSSA